MRKIFHQHLVIIYILCGIPILAACSSIPLLSSPTPAPECIGDTWSYDKTVQTKIDINSDLKITINSFAPDVIQRTSESSTVTIDGNGRVRYSSESRQASGSILKNTVEKQIPIDLLQQIVAAFEEANFYAITTGCGELIIMAGDAPTLDISVETEGKVHEIKDKGACAVYNFDQYCELDDKIDSILETHR